MKVGEENQWRLSGIKLPSTRTRTKMLTSFESHRFDRVIFATRLEPAKKYGEIFISEMQAFFDSFALLRQNLLGNLYKKKYKEFK